VLDNVRVTLNIQVTPPPFIIRNLKELIRSPSTEESGESENLILLQCGAINLDQRTFQRPYSKALDGLSEPFPSS